MCSRLFANKIAKAYRKVEGCKVKSTSFLIIAIMGSRGVCCKAKGCSIRPFKIILADIFLGVPLADKGTAFMACRLKLTGEVSEAEWAYAFCMENDGMSDIAEWCREGITSEIDNLRHLSKHNYKWWLQLYDERANIMIRNIKEFQGDRQAEYELLSGQEIERLILIPLERYGNFGGMVGLDNLSVEVFKDAEKSLRTFGCSIMLAVRRNEDERTLYWLSYIDTLTKFYNHNRCIQGVEEFSGKETAVGMAFIDMNSLEEINDRFGHEAGDQLPQTGVAIIQNSVPEGNLYRVGGDELVIIYPNVEEAEFRDIIQKLKDTFNRKERKTAVGYEWTHFCRNLKAIIHSAD